MRSRFTVSLALAALAGVASTSAFAAGCELTSEQAGFLAENNVAVEIPLGEVPMIQRCDTDGNGSVDINDIRAISLARNQPAAHPDDPMDYDKNNRIDLLDARGCQALCTEPRCAESTTPPSEPQGVQDTAQCAQAEDLDNDGQVDQVIAVADNEPGGATGERTLGVVFVQKVEGQVRAVKDAYVGKTRAGTVDLHLSKQPAGPITLGPGQTVVLTQPASVAYQDGQPKVLYYVEDGRLRRAAFGVDD